MVHKLISGRWESLRIFYCADTLLFLIPPILNCSRKLWLEIFSLINLGGILFLIWVFFVYDVLLRTLLYLAKDFICKLLIVDPNSRWTASQALHHPFILINCFQASQNPSQIIIPISRPIPIRPSQPIKVFSFFKFLIIFILDRTSGQETSIRIS